MNRRARLRRTGILCLHCLRNAAYYRAWNAAPRARRQEQFWRTINSNCIDICVLEWCKVFGDLRAKHHWSKSVSDQDAFVRALYARLSMDEQEFEVFRLAVRHYRGKFVAHLDEENRFNVPLLQPIIDSTRFLYNYLVEVEDDVNAFHDAPDRADARFTEHLLEGRQAHRA